MVRRKLLISASVFFGLTLLLDQVLQHVCLNDGELLGRRVAPFDPPILTSHQQAFLDRLEKQLANENLPERSSKFDPELGWCPLANSKGEETYDWSGSRVGFRELSRTKTEGVRRIVAVGCSFTRGDEVGAKETWAALLDRDAEDIEVANLGVGGFGIDQALLRLKRDGMKLQPDEVWLGLLPLATPRTQSVYRPALQRWSKTPAFKPRFELDENGLLALIPSPSQSLAQAHELLTDQQSFLDALDGHDRFIANSPIAWGVRGSSWLHHSGIARLVMTWNEPGGRDPIEMFADPDDPMPTLLRELCLEAKRESEAAQARFRLLILPGRFDLDQRLRDGHSYWEDLANELREADIEVVDITKDLLDAGFGEDDQMWMPGTHYSPAGNEVVARVLARRTK